MLTSFVRAVTNENVKRETFFLSEMINYVAWETKLYTLPIVKLHTSMGKHVNTCWTACDGRIVSPVISKGGFSAGLTSKMTDQKGSVGGKCRSEE